MNEAIDPAAATDFFGVGSIALVGASDNPKRFSQAVYKALKEHGVSVVPVNPNEQIVGDDACYPDIASVPTPVDGVMVMLKHDSAVQIVQQCVALDVKNVWLFKGIGGDSAVSDEALALCHENGINVIPGACPMMFLRPVGGLHRIHRGIRRVKRAVRNAA